MKINKTNKTHADQSFKTCNIIKTNENSITQFMVPIQNVKMTVGLIWNTGGTETEIIIPVSVLGPQRAGTEMGGDHRILVYSLSMSMTDDRSVRYRFKFQSCR